MKVELIYDEDCPNAQGARELIGTAIKKLRPAAEYVEHCRQDKAAPDYVRAYGSPSILVNGVDIFDPEHAQTGDSCRLYRDARGVSGLPPVSALESALAGTEHTGLHLARQTSLLAALGTFGLAALPALTCPACWPAYAGLIGALGLGFFNYTPYVTPALLLLAPLSLGTVAWQSYRARHARKHAYLPVVVGALGVLTLFAARWLFPVDSLQYAGIGLLVWASVWNVWRPRPKPIDCDC